MKLQNTKSIHRNLLHSYTLTVKNKKEKALIPFTIATKKNIILGVNLPKETKDLYGENYTLLMKEIKKMIQTDGEIYHVLGLEDSIL